LRVILPQRPPQYVYYTRESPLLVLDQYTGEHEEGRSPDWVQTITKPLVIFQPRTFMVDIVAFLAMVDINKELSHRALHWCQISKLVSVSPSSFQISFTYNFLNRHRHSRYLPDLKTPTLARIRSAVYLGEKVSNSGSNSTNSHLYVDVHLHSLFFVYVFLVL
jgi:hypothetical protein